MLADSCSHNGRKLTITCFPRIHVVLYFVDEPRRIGNESAMRFLLDSYGYVCLNMRFQFNRSKILFLYLQLRKGNLIYREK